MLPATVLHADLVPAVVCRMEVQRVDVADDGGHAEVDPAALEGAVELVHVQRAATTVHLQNDNRKSITSSYGIFKVYGQAQQVGQGPRQACVAWHVQQISAAK